MSDDCRKCCDMVKAADQCPHARAIEVESVECEHCGIHGQLADVIGTAHGECVGKFVDHEFVADRIADAVLSSGLVVPAAIHKVATDALETGDACGAVGCRALVERDAAWERAETAEREWRDGWADWISNGTSAAGLPEPFTLDTVIGWLRSDRTPFGFSANPAALDTTPRA